MKRIITALVFLVGASQAQAVTKHMKHLKGAYVGVGQEYISPVKEARFLKLRFLTGKVGYTKVHLKKIGYGIEGVYGVGRFALGKDQNIVGMAVKPMLTYGLTRGSHIYLGAQLGQLKVINQEEDDDDSPRIAEAAEKIGYKSLGGQVGLVARVYRNLSIEGELGYHQWTSDQDKDARKETATSAAFGLRYTF